MHIRLVQNRHNPNVAIPKLHVTKKLYMYFVVQVIIRHLLESTQKRAREQRFMT